MPLQEFLVTPLQLGMPYSRPRYYALGRRKRADGGSCSFPVPALPSGKPFAGPAGPLLSSHRASKEQGTLQPAEPSDSHAAIAPLSQYLDSDTGLAKAPAECRHSLAPADSASEKEDQSVKLQAQQAEHHASRSGSLQAAANNKHDVADPVDSLPQRSASPVHRHSHEDLQQSAAVNGRHMPGPDEASAQRDEARKLSNGAEYVPQNVIEQWGQSLDIVGPESRRCNCFTKTYFRWVKASSHQLPPAIDHKKQPGL